MNIFITEDDVIPIDFVVATKDRVVFVANKKEEFTGELDGFTFEDHSAVVRQPSFLDSAIITDKSIEVTPDGRVTISPSVLRYHRLKTLLVSWTLKDKKGDPMPITDGNVANLNNAIGTHLSAKMEDCFGVL